MRWEALLRGAAGRVAGLGAGRGVAAADFEDGRAEAVDLLLAHAGDGEEMREGAGVVKDDVAQRGGSEDEELGESDLFGFGFAPVAELGVEGLLGGGEGRLGERV